MPEYLAPGVYVEEVQTGPPPIAPVGTSTAGFVGVTRRGPIEGPPTLVTNYAEFVRAFGGAFDFGSTFENWRDLPHAMRGFFDNGGRRAFVSRVSAAAATSSQATLTGGLTTRLIEDTAINPAAVQDRARPRSLRGVHVGTQVQFRMVRDGVTTTSAVLQVTQLNRDTGEIRTNNPISTTTIFEAGRTVVLTDLASGLDAAGIPVALATPTTAKPNTFQLTASSPGTWGRDISIVPVHESAARSPAVGFVGAPAVNDNRVQLNSTAGFYIDAWVEIDQGNTKRYRRILSIDGPVVVLDGPAMAAPNDIAPQAPATETRVSTCEFGLTIAYTDPVERVAVTERLSGLTLENIAGRFYRDRINDTSMLVVAGAPPANLNPFFYPSAADGLTTSLSGGSDVVPNDADVVGFDNGPNRKTGLLSLEEVDEIAILAAPGLTSQAVQNALKDQSERLMDRFAVLDPVRGASNTPATIPQIQAQRDLYDTKYAALYYPRVVIADPINPGGDLAVAPSGHVLGIYARVDNTRGVHKAPGNEVIRGILNVETVVSRGVQEILNPRNINVIRDLRSMQRGFRVYGARCATSDTQWNYINVRQIGRASCRERV